MYIMYVRMYAKCVQVVRGRVSIVDWSECGVSERGEERFRLRTRNDEVWR